MKMKPKRIKLKRSSDSALLIFQKDFTDHTKSDADNFKKIIDQLKTFETTLGAHIKDQDKRWTEMEPMMKVFSDNKIVRTRLSGDAKTIFFYAGGLATVVALFYAIGHYGKIILVALFK